jgi:hypothetical protein
MPKSKQEIIDDIKSHMQKRRGDYSDWYVGISKAAKDRLLNGHSVKENKDVWIYRKASSSKTAREIEDYFVNTLDTDGDTGGGDDTSNMVYAYKKAKHTKP